MAARPALTILVIRNGMLTRADFGAGAAPRLLNQWQQQRLADLRQMDLPALVQSALELGPGCGKQVWVLAEEIFAQSITLAGASTQGLDEEQTARALAFEIEPFSAIPPSEAAVAFHTLGGDDSGPRTFWVTAMRNDVRILIQDAVRRAGAKLLGITHPAGLPTALDPASNDKPWRRVECWYQAMLCINRTGNDTRIQFLNSGSGGARAQNSLSGWRLSAATEYSEVLDAGDSTPPIELQPPQWRIFKLSNREELASWLTGWATQALAAKPAVPFLRPVVVPLSLNTKIAIAVVLEVAAIVLCYFHWTWTTKQTQDFQKQATEYREPARRSQELEQQVKTSTANLEKLEKEDAELSATRKAKAEERLQTSTATQQQRGMLFRMLKAFANQKPADLSLVSVLTDSDGIVRVNGWCMEVSQADEFAVRLSSALAPDGWTVAPHEKKSLKLLADGGPWQFKFELRPAAVKPAPLSTPAASLADAPEANR